MSDLRTRTWRTLEAHGVGWIGNGKPDAHCLCGHIGGLGESWHFHVADAVISELTIQIPPIVASAIHSYADSELAAMSHHGHPEAIWEMERLNQHAASIANYATTHEKWNGKADDE